MPDQRIVDFIRQSLQQGYDINTIKSHLLQQGFSGGDISDAINSVYTVTEVKHVHGLSPALLIVLALIGVGLLVTGVVLFISPAEQLLDVELEGVQMSAEAGKELVFSIKITNMGEKRRYDANMRYELLDSKGKVVAFKEETVAVETTASRTARLLIPAKAFPGSHVVRVEAKYDGKIATAKLPATVTGTAQAVESCYDGIWNQDEDGIDCGSSCPNRNCCNNGFQDENLGEGGKDCGGPCNPCETECDKCDDNNPCTEDICGAQTNYICTHEALTPCCGNAICESGESGTCTVDCPATGSPFEGLSQGDILGKIKNIAKSDPKLAESYCGKYLTSIYKDSCYINLATEQADDSYCRNVEEERNRDGCYAEVSKLTGKYEPCRKITNDIKRDSCYFNYGTATGDYTVCDVILNEEIRRSCSTLKQISELQEQQAS
ncbi:MAG TPA: hypothetical protein VJI46_01750 [Candidatus Nanoarchaeia archaeon]|nr:hypothetical protein [Candidatus Nanoarchaeia archaeon]